MPDLSVHNRPPVRIGPAAARGHARLLKRGASRVADGADRFSAREGVFASVGLRLRIDKGSTTPNSQVATSAVIPMGTTRRKQGYPPIQLP